MASSSSTKKKDTNAPSSSSSSPSPSSSSLFSASVNGNPMIKMREALMKQIAIAKTATEKNLAQKNLEFFDRNILATSQTTIDRSSIRASGTTVDFYGYVFGDIVPASGRKPALFKLVMPILLFTMITPGPGVEISNDLNMFSLKNADGKDVRVYTNSSLFISMFGATSGFNPRGGWHLFQGVQLPNRVTYDEHGNPYRNFNCTKVTFWQEGPPKTAMVDVVSRMFSGPRYPLHRMPPEYYPSKEEVAAFIERKRHELQEKNPEKQINMNALFSIQEQEEAHRFLIFSKSMNSNIAIDPHGMNAYIHESRSMISPSVPAYVPTEMGEPVVAVSNHEYSPQILMMKDGKPKLSDASDAYPFTVKGRVDFVQTKQQMLLDISTGTLTADSLLVHGSYALGEKFYPFYGIVDPVDSAILLSTPAYNRQSRLDCFPSFVTGTIDHGRTAVMGCNTKPNLVGDDGIPQFGLEVVPFHTYPLIIAGIRNTCVEITVEFLIWCINRKLRKAGINTTREDEASIAPLVPTGEEVNEDGYRCRRNLIHEWTEGMAFNITESDIFYVRQENSNARDFQKRNPVTRGSAANFRFYMMANVIHSRAEDYCKTQEDFFGLENGNPEKVKLGKKLDEYAKVHSTELRKIMTDDVSDVFSLDRSGAIPGLEFRFVFNAFAVSKTLDGAKEWTKYSTWSSEEFSEETIQERIKLVKDLNMKKIEANTRTTVNDDELAALEAAEKGTKSPVKKQKKPEEDLQDDTEVVEEEDEEEGEEDEEEEEEEEDEELVDDDEDGKDLKVPDPSPPFEELVQKTKGKVTKVSQTPTKEATPPSTPVKPGKRLGKMIDEGAKATASRQVKSGGIKKVNRG